MRGKNMSEENIKVNKEEGKSKKREWIKNIAIIFLSIMLLLTFFSNTIMNRTLPQVSTQYVQDGIIESQVRGTGRVEAIDPYSVTLQETGTIASVVKKEGEHVEAGDVIYKLQGEESEELIKAREELASLELEYKKAIITNRLTRNDVAMIENGTVTSLGNAQATIEGYDSSVDSLEKEILSLQRQINSLQTQVDVITGKVTLGSVIDLTSDKKKKENERDRLPEGDPKRDAIQKEIDEIQDKIDDANHAIDVANLNNTLNVETIKEQITLLTSQKIEKELTLKDKTDNRDEKVDDYNHLLDAEAAYKKILTKKDEVDKLEAKALGGEITAPVAGTLTTLSYTAGEKTVAGEAAAVIQIDGKGYKTSFPVSIKQANAINVGDNVTLVDAWMLGDAKANLVSITKDKDKPGENKILNFELNGDQVQDGMNITLSVGEKSSRYEYIVPNAAIREDNNGKFVLILQSKSTPFGNRYMAERTDVEVLAKDDKNTAISGNIGSYEYVILTSSKPIKSGDQVRMAE